MQNQPYYTAIIDIDSERGDNAKCDNCGEIFALSDGLPIDAASVTPGDPSPACRCPCCECLSYQTQDKATWPPNNGDDNGDDFDAQVVEAMRSGDATALAEMICTNLTFSTSAKVYQKIGDYLLSAMSGDSIGQSRHLKEAGEGLAETLLMHSSRDQDGQFFVPMRWDTAIGNKTGEGLFRTVIDQLHKRVTAYAFSKEQ